MAVEVQRQSSAIKGLEPKLLWQYFDGLSQLPRPSKHEDKVLAWLKAFAEERKLAYQQDAEGNMVIRRPGSGGGEGAPPIIVQGHIDMVTEKNSDVIHDFFKDPIRLRLEGGWIKAEGTTLGADNGIGVAAALALLDSGADEKLPPLECLFTVDEETGLTGAFGLDASILSGKTMLNLDTEDWNEIFIGCAGGGDSVLTLPVQREAAPPSCRPLQLSITGLLGGHSGLNIAEGRGNAVKMSAEILDALLSSLPEARLGSLRAGDKRNALPREATAMLYVPEGSINVAEKVVGDKLQAFRDQFHLKEENLSISLESASGNLDQVLTPASADSLLALLLVVPHGVAKLSHAVEGLVETSNNLAAANPSEDGANYKIIMSSRSSIGSALESQRAVIARAARLCKASCEQDNAYPGWQPNLESEVVKLTQEVMEKVTGKAPKVGAIHAGLECGLLGDKIPGLDMVSYGPTIRGAHSPDERVEVSTVEPFWQTTLQLLERLADVEA